MAEKPISTASTITTARGAQPPPAPPTITLPPRPSMDALFTGGFSPGPMTLISSLFSDNYPDGSFSQLLALASPIPRPSFFSENSIPNSTAASASASAAAAAAAPPPPPPPPPPPIPKEDGSDKNSNLGFKQSRPLNLVVARSPLFTVPPGLSPSGLLNSPGFFSPQSPFGMSHQQALAQVTAQAALAAQSQIHMQTQCQPSSVVAPNELLAHHPSYTAGEAAQQQMPPSTSQPHDTVREPSEISHSDRRYQASLAVDKPSDDGYNWRKYGQKPIKGSEYPRSYYKCTHPKCPVKKKVERSSNGQITEIIYKGQHNHELPQPNKRSRDSSDPVHAKPELGSQVHAVGIKKLTEAAPTNTVSGRDQESIQADPTEIPASSDSEEAGDGATREDQADDDEPNPKRRNTDVGASEVALPHKTVTEPKIIVQTRSEVDLLDDGYRWRKYGQKVVKGNPHPRSYYKCTNPGCNVRKHVERAATDPKAVITTYEGKHNHDVPAARNSSHAMANNNAPAPQSNPPNVVAEKHPRMLKGMDFGNNDQRPILLRLKQEEIRV